jgi:hypothetical protein
MNRNNPVQSRFSHLHKSIGQSHTNSRRSNVLTKKFCPTILVLLALATHGVVQAADMPIDCKLRGGSVVQLPAEACKMEGGTQVIKAVPPAPVAVPAAVDAGSAKDQRAASLSELTEAQKAVIDLLGKPVEVTTLTNRNPEGIERTAKFDGCRLVVDENLHIQYGNFYSVWKDFKINSVIDFRKINRDEYGILGEVGSKGGDLKGTAVYIEERKNKDGNNISISVLNLRNDAYTKYTTHGPSAYWSTPRDDLWMADEYGYVKDSGSKEADFGVGNPVEDKIRILLIVKTSDDAEKLKNTFEEVNTTCNQQSTVSGSK